MEKFCQFKGIIYKYSNNFNNKVYIGQTIHEVDRKRQHKLSVFKETHFSRAIRKYGFDNFTYTVLFEVSCNNKQDLINTLNSKEIIAIRYYDSTNIEKGYNISKGGSGTIGVEPWNKGRHNVYSKEHINHLAELHRNKPLSDKVKQKISETKMGSTPWNKGKTNVYSEEARKKMSLSHKLLGTNGCERQVNQYDKDGNFIRSYNSIKEAIEITKVINISPVCQGKRKTAGGYIWKYANA